MAIDPDIAGRLAKDTAFHDKIREYVRNRIEFSRRNTENRHVAWREAERKFRAFLDLDAAQEQRKRKASGEENYPGFAPIVVPVSYAQHQTTLTFLMSVFGSQHPLRRVAGRRPEYAKAGDAMEAVIAYQDDYYGAWKSLYFLFSDMLTYGQGIITNEWRTLRSYQEVRRLRPVVGKALKFFGLEEQAYERWEGWVKGYEGNMPQQWSPFRIHPDPRVPLSRLQQGEFFGVTTRESIGALLKKEREGIYVNIKKIQEAFSTVSGREKEDQSDMPRIMNLPDSPDITDLRNKSISFPLIDILFADVIPQNLELNATEAPQKWIFAVANEQTVIQAERLGFHHDEFPVVAAEYSPDQHSIFNPGLIETVGPMETILTWLINSHMENVRKVINDEVIYDPSRIVEADLKRPGPGRLIRLKPEAYGTDVNSAITQFKIQDITQAHLKDAEVLLSLIQRTTGATDNFQGVPTVGARRTATEVHGTQQLSASRLKLLAELQSSLAIIPWTKQMVANTRQLMEDEVYIRIAGHGADARFLSVSPEDLLAEYDFPVGDAGLPIDKVDIAQVWKDIFTSIAQSEALQQEFDIFEVFKKAVSVYGVVNIDDFRKRPPGTPPPVPNPVTTSVSVKPDGEVERQVKLGNIVPLDGNSGDELIDSLARVLGPMSGNGRHDG